MAKFNVGDKVRVKNFDTRPAYWSITGSMDYLMGKLVTVKEYVTEHGFIVDGGWALMESDVELEYRREFIVIHRSGNVMTAEHRVNREIIKSAKATCAPSDTFDFDTGAKLAFDRLMWREEPKPEPKPAHGFKVGDRVVIEESGEIGEVSAIKSGSCQYLVFHKSGMHSGGGFGVKVAKPEHEQRCSWFSEMYLSPAPAPEPPKFYTGKVFAEKIIECDAQEEMRNRIGRVFEIKNGIIQGDVKQYDLDDYDPIVSFSDFCLKAKSTKWHEVKSDV